MTRLSNDTRGHRVEEISRLEHELKSSLETVSAFEAKMAKAAVELQVA